MQGTPARSPCTKSPRAPGASIRVSVGLTPSSEQICQDTCFPSPPLFNPPQHRFPGVDRTPNAITQKPAVSGAANKTELSAKVEAELFVEYDAMVPGPAASVAGNNAGGLDGSGLERTGRPLKINLDLLSYQAKQKNIQVREGGIREVCTPAQPSSSQAGQHPACTTGAKRCFFSVPLEGLLSPCTCGRSYHQAALGVFVAESRARRFSCRPVPSQF